MSFFRCFITVSKIPFAPCRTLIILIFKICLNITPDLNHHSWSRFYRKQKLKMTFREEEVRHFLAFLLRFFFVKFLHEIEAMEQIKLSKKPKGQNYALLFQRFLLLNKFISKNKFKFFIEKLCRNF